MIKGTPAAMWGRGGTYHVALTLALLASACTTEVPAAERGGELFRDPGLSPSAFNAVSCATCHQTGATPDTARIDSGYSLHGVAARDSYWGGRVYRLIDAVNTCLVFFMRADPLADDDPDGRALYEYLLSITPDGAPSDPIPMTIVENILPLPPGDQAAGEAIYDAACRRCHGEAVTGAGNILDALDDDYVLPNYALDNYPVDFPGVAPGLVVIEKVRHGRFFDIGGSMAPFSTEALTNEQLADLLAFLGLPSE